MHEVVVRNIFKAPFNFSPELDPRKNLPSQFLLSDHTEALTLHQIAFSVHKPVLWQEWKNTHILYFTLPLSWLRPEWNDDDESEMLR